MFHLFAPLPLCKLPGCSPTADGRENNHRSGARSAVGPVVNQTFPGRPGNLTATLGLLTQEKGKRTATQKQRCAWLLHPLQENPPKLVTTQTPTAEDRMGRLWYVWAEVSQHLAGHFSAARGRDAATGANPVGIPSGRTRPKGILSPGDSSYMVLEQRQN